MSLELIIFLAALLVSWLVFTWFIQVLKASISTALAVAAIILVLQLWFGIGPQEFIEIVLAIRRKLLELLPNPFS
ncbi:MAG: hypothetical protein ACFBSC_03375 [Microcoleaceae cyanobacterium]